MAIGRWEAEERGARREAAELRQALASVEAESDEVVALQGDLSLELRHLRGEAEEAWAAHELPLRETEIQGQAAREMTEALLQAAVPQTLALDSLQAECRELAALCESLQHQADAAEYGCHEHRGKAKSSEEEREALAARHLDSEGLVRELRRVAAFQQERAARVRAEADEKRREAHAAQRRMADRERWLRTEALQQHRDMAAGHEALAFRARTLRSELESGELRLEAQARESAVLRQQALRGESRLCALRGEDVAGALRSLQAQCQLFAREEVAPGVASPSFGPRAGLAQLAAGTAAGSGALRAG